MERRVFLLSLLGVMALPTWAGPSRPMVLIFPTTLGRLAPVTAVTPDNPTPDGLSDGDRIMLAARAVRAKLDEEKVVDTLLFDPANIFFQRALEAARIKLKPDAEMTESERLQLGASVGAHYILNVFSRLSTEVAPPKETGTARKPGVDTGAKPGGQIGLPNDPTLLNAPTLEIELVQLKPGGKVGVRWQNRIAVAASNDVVRVQRQQALPAGLESAARTLVLRLLGGPLREFTRNTIDSNLLPPTSTPAVAVAEAPPLDFDLESGKLMERAKEQLSHNSIPAAILLLRQAVNYAPRKAQPRLLLTQAYIQAKHPGDAVNEARRALVTVPALTVQERGEFSRLMARAMLEDGDQDAATQMFTDLLKEDPNNTEARLGLAEILLTRGESAAAEIQFRLIRQSSPNNLDAAKGLAQILVSKGALEEVIKEAKTGPPAAQHAMATVVFLDSAGALAAKVTQNRAAWEQNKLSREIFYKATASQSARAQMIADLLSASPPPESEREVERMAHNRRVLAANLLAQAFSSLQGFLESGEAAQGSRARTLINEFYNEMKDAQNPAGAKG